MRRMDRDFSDTDRDYPLSLNDRNVYNQPSQFDQFDTDISLLPSSQMGQFGKNWFSPKW